MECPECGETVLYMIERDDDIDVPGLERKRKRVYECSRCHKVKDKPWVCKCTDMNVDWSPPM